jgi:glutamine synthetase
MTNARLTIDEAQAFLGANPHVQWIDAFVFDMNGIPRGKRIRRSDLLGVAKNGLMMPTSVFIMDPLGNCIEETGRLWETGDQDHHCHLLSRTLVPVPVGDGKHAQVVMVIDAKDELDPRTVLVDQVARFTRAGQTPVAAVELEFYVTSRSTNGAFALNTPEGLSDDPGRPLTFGFEQMDTLSPFIDDVYLVCEVPGLPVDTVMQESGPDQFEINLTMAAHWGFNNRTVALRIPRGNGTTTRIEHRVAGADANPYLVIASILAGMNNGISNAIDPGPAVEGNSETIEAPLLPTAWVNSLDLFQRSDIVRGAFGAPFQDVFSRLKHAERSNFEPIVTPLDYLWYARVA